MEQRINEAETLVCQTLSAKRCEHTFAVARRAEFLAEKYGADRQKAYLAGLLHDITKEFPAQKQLKMLRDSDIIYDTVILCHDNLYHAFTAKVYCSDTLGIDDTEILDAIAFHTIARPGMTLLQKIVYVADATSSDRTYPDVSSYRELCDRDLDLGFYEILRDIMIRLLKKEEVIPADTLLAYNEQRLRMKGFTQKCK